MADRSKIEWTDATWNPVTGCTKVSMGCLNCYAEKYAIRLKAAHNPSYKNGFTVAMHENLMSLPLTWHKSRNIFVNSMSDLFHEDIPDNFILSVFEIMKKATWHRFQILTKRPKRLLNLNRQLAWADNIWMGVSVESIQYVDRVVDLKQVGAKTKFLSFEPLLGPIIDVNLNGIDWVIVGGESGPGARPIMPEWVISIRNQCQRVNVPFFFKQWGGVRKKKAGRELEGRIWSEMPCAKLPAEGNQWENNYGLGLIIPK